ncbi:MAG: GNAT family N-acetyltransferase [Candidatus Lokiarchaeota archaeon]|nr:GNAT family N-acetyltransferase [Candidatus Lokiarchaeota archaeon]
MIRQIKDKESLYNFFKKDVFLFAYHIGDLDDFYFSDCKWFGIEENGQILEVILLYSGLKVPTLLLFGSVERIPYLVKKMIDKLPDRFYCHYQGNFHELFRPDYRMTSLGTHLKMKYQGAVSKISNINTCEIIQLTEKDIPDLLILYQQAYPEGYFVPYMVKTGKYYGVRVDNRIISVAGVHVFSTSYNIAVLGNITTHPKYRGKGLAKKCTARLLKSFNGEIDRIGLNVKKDNITALKLYEDLGFIAQSTYKEAYFEKIR